jgi:hypothetical protein
MSGRVWTRRGLKALHEVAAIGIGGGLATCLVIDLVVPQESAADFVAARLVVASISRYVLLPSLAVVLVSGLLAIAATRGYRDAGWAWVKALLGLSVFEATLTTIGASRDPAEMAVIAADPELLASWLHSERATLWLLLALCLVNVVLAVWRPKLMIRIR